MTTKIIFKLSILSFWMWISDDRINTVTTSKNIDDDYILTGIDKTGNIITSKKYVFKHEKSLKEKAESFFVDFFSSDKSDRFIKRMLWVVLLIIFVFIFLMLI